MFARTFRLFVHIQDFPGESKIAPEQAAIILLHIAMNRLEMTLFVGRHRLVSPSASEWLVSLITH
jgi:hypothetical protein